MHVEDAVDIIVREDEIVIRRQRPRASMTELLQRFDPERHQHELQLDGEPAGNETR